MSVNIVKGGKWMQNLANYFLRTRTYPACIQYLLKLHAIPPNQLIHREKIKCFMTEPEDKLFQVRPNAEDNFSSPKLLPETAEGSKPAVRVEEWMKVLPGD